MNENNVFKKYDCFFASANGYDGFKSYFSNVFDRDKFDRIFILKGGPGTGKSSLMKRLLFTIGDKASAEAIFCSSDSASLDGVIFESSKKKIAILDGTAPHTVDPLYPGAVDEIINLGDAWNRSLLKEKAEIIRKITNLKSTAYKEAYDYLKICGIICKTVQSDIGSLSEESNLLAKSLVNKIEKKGTRSIRLISSLGKNGFGYLDTFEKSANEIYKIVGIYGSEYLFINKLKLLAEKENLMHILAPSPLSPDLYDAIFFPEEKIAVICGNRAPDAKSTVIDTAKLLDQKNISEKRNKLEFLWKEHETMLWSAADAFRRASDAHFELEKIYVESMDFSYNDTVFEKIRDEILEIFSVT